MADQRIRKTGLDLLRLLLMCMVVTLHYLVSSRAFFTVTVTEAAYTDAVRFTGMVFEALSVVAVNTFVILSGYLLFEATFRTGRLVELIATVVFYALFMWIVGLLLGMEAPAGAYALVQQLFPVSSSYYWFMSAYVLLYILSPLLSAGVRALDKRQLRLAIGLFLIWTTLIKSLVPVVFATDDGGYSLTWFLALFLIGAYIRKYEQDFAGSGKKGLIVYLLSALFVLVLSYVVFSMYRSTGRFQQLLSMLTHYNFILNLTGAAGLFLCFREIHLKEGDIAQKIVTTLSPHALGVYLTHAHPVFFSFWLALLCARIGQVPADNPALFVLHLIGCVLIVFVIGIAADVVRGLLFRLLTPKKTRE